MTQSSKVTITSYQVRPHDNEILLMLLGTDQDALYEYLLFIYETHGIIDEKTDTRFITAQPTFRIISSQTMEVTITHA